MTNTVIRLGFISISTGGGAGFEEYANLAAFPPIGQPDTIYVALDTNKTYRWSGSTYVEISPSEVISVNGKIGVVVLDKSDIGLGNVDNTSDLDKPISNATQNALNDLSDSFNYQQVVYVDKSNSKIYTPDGSINKPYKSIEAMYNAITDASASKRYACIIAPGTYTENSSIRLKGWIDLVPFATDTVIIGVSGGATLKWSNNSPGRVFIRDMGISVGLEIINDNPTGTSGLVFDLDNVDAPSLLFRGRGGGVDYIQLRNDTRIENTCTIQSAATTIFDSTNIGNLILNDVDCITPDPYGSAITASFRSNYIGQIQITATNYDIYTDIWGTIIAGSLTIISNSPSYPCYFNYDATSYPLGSVTLSGSNSPQLVRTSAAQSIRYTPSTPANWALPNPEEVQKALDDLAAKDTIIEGDLNNKVDKAGDTMTGPLNMSALSENIQFSIYGLNASQGIEIKSDDDPTRPTGNVTLKTGDASGSDAAGSIYLQGGSNVDGNPSNILLTAGQSSGTGSDGVIVLDAKGVVYLNDNASGSIDASSHRIQNVEDPIADQDAATRKWVDEMSAIDNVLFVSPNANSFIADGTLHRPYATIAAALAVAVDNNVIALLPGTYSEPTVVIPSSLSFLVIQGVASPSTIITNGISYTPGASSIDLLIQKVNIGVLTLDATTAFNGLVTLKQVITGFNRQDSNTNVFMIITESNCFGGVIKGGGNNFSECLIVVSMDIESGALAIFENTKFVGYLSVYGAAVVRLLDCDLFGASYFVDGSIDFGFTPTIEIDTVSDYLGSLNGDYTKVLLANIPLSNLTDSGANPDQYIKFDGANWIPSNLEASITDYSPAQPADWIIPPGVVSDGLDELASRVTTVEDNIISTNDVFLDTHEPTGFLNRTDSIISFNDISREFTIQPTLTSFEFYIKGTKYTKTVSESITIPNTDGNHYIYYNAIGNLESTTVFTSSIIEQFALISVVYWNSSTTSHTYFAEERHGITMDGVSHAYLHTVFGARYLSGLALQGFSVDGSGNLAEHAQFTADTGSLRDEDILHVLPAAPQIPILYRQGSLWRKKAADAYPIIYSGTAGYTGANGRLPYNQFVAGNWQLTEIANSSYVLVHFFGTNDIDNPIVGIHGINEYNSIASARLGANAEITSLSGLPFAEFVAIGSVIFESATGYGNVPKARVVSTDLGANYVDFRGTQLYTPAGEATTHGLLSGLANDDHPQYHTDARGDARYNLKSPGDISETSFSLANNQAIAQSITGFSFSNAVVRSFFAEASVRINATSSLFEQFTINGIQKSSDWDISISSVGDISGITFSINSSGQLQYTSSNYSGFVSGTIKFKAFTTSV